jgi:hypothetical protein
MVCVQPCDCSSPRTRTLAHCMRRACSAKPSNASSVPRRSRATSKITSACTSGTTPPHMRWLRLAALWMRFPNVSARSALCMSMSDSSEYGTSEPYTPPRMR